MVKRLLALALVFLVAAAAAAGPASAQSSVDWRNAGGALFADAGPQVPAGDADPPRTVRLTAPVQPFDVLIADAAGQHGLDPKLLHALVAVESAYRAEACSPAGACGLTQLMPGTASDLGVTDRLDPVQNLNGGADYLARQIVRFGDLRLALAAYNAGPDRVARLGRIPDFVETRHYVAAVIDCYLALTAGRGIRSARECAPAQGDL